MKNNFFKTLLLKINKNNKSKKNYWKSMCKTITNYKIHWEKVFLFLKEDRICFFSCDVIQNNIIRDKALKKDNFKILFNENK